MAVDIEYITDTYFAFDEPVPYQLKAGRKIFIKPFYVTDRNQFIQVSSLLREDKRDKHLDNKPELDFLVEDVIGNEEIFWFVFAMFLGKHIEYKMPCVINSNSSYYIATYHATDEENEQDRQIVFDEDSIITSEEWEDIKRIILYQNDPDYDDTFYYDETIRRNLEIESRLKSKGTVSPSFERQLYIIMAHTGIPKEEQLKLTLRGFKMLFMEVIGEAEFFASYALRAKYSEKGHPADHWIWQHKVTGMDKIGVKASSFIQSLGFNDEEIFKDDEAPAAPDVDIEEIRRRIAEGTY